MGEGAEGWLGKANNCHPFAAVFPDADDCLTNGPESVSHVVRSASIWQMRARAGSSGNLWDRRYTDTTEN